MGKTQDGSEPGGALLSAGKEAEGTFAQRLEIAMADQSALAFAKKCGISDSLVRKYLHGSLPGLAKLVVLAKVGNVRVGWLATGEMPMMEVGDVPLDRAHDNELKADHQKAALAELGTQPRFRANKPVLEATRLDLATEADAIHLKLDALEEVITKTRSMLQKRNISLNPEAEARIIRLIYEFYLRQGEPMDEAMLNNIIELAAFR